MSNYSYFRRRVYGPRCSSPPTFICYELPQPEPYSRSSSPTSSDDEGSGEECEDSGSESTSNHDDDGRRSEGSLDAPVERMQMDVNAPIGDRWEVVDGSEQKQAPMVPVSDPQGVETANLEPQDIPCPSSGNEDEAEDASSERLRAEKREGKKKEVIAVDEGADAKPETQGEQETVTKKKTRRRRTRRRHAEDYEPVYRPILTIRSSQGFVWNQDLFVPSYIKERYIASSPPSSFAPMGSSPSNKSQLVNNNFFSSSDQMDYEVECVEIHLDESELGRLVPRA